MSDEIKTEETKANGERPNYRIFHVAGDLKKEKICDSEICLKSEEDAISYVENLRKNSGTEYYWEPILYVGRIGGKEKKIEMDKEVSFSYSDSYLGIEKDKPKEKVWDRVVDFMTSLPYKAERKIPEMRYAFQRALFKYDNTVSWNIGHELIDLLKTNLPKMAKNLNGCPTSYLVRAKMIIDNISEEEAEKKFRSNYTETHREMEVAIGLWKGDLLDLLEKIKLLGYYMEAGLQYGIEIGDPDWVDPKKHPIPMKKYSFQPDYEEIEKLFKKTNAEVFEFLRDHWTELWD